MEILARRALLDTLDNTDQKLDYVVTLEETFNFAGNGEKAIIQLRYIPDKLVLTPNSFSDYLAAFANLSWSSLEETTSVVLDDLNNEVVARWIQIHTKMATSSDDSFQNHQVFLEDHQPHWDNPRLLARLKAV